jgi:hypothetical protein
VVEIDDVTCHVCGETFTVKYTDGIPDEQLGLLTLEVPDDMEWEGTLVACEACRRAVANVVQELRKKGMEKSAKRE